MNSSTPKDNSHTRRAGVHLRDHLRFFIRYPTHHEYDDILRLVANVATTFKERILQFL